MPVDPVRVVGAYVRAQMYPAVDPLTAPPEAPVHSPAAEGASADPDTAVAHAVIARPMSRRRPGRLARLLLFFRQDPAPAPDLRQP
ncbi:hypothetical protein CTZ27_29280 [Streptomyces griseocarneus]|nr:hypothetical protein CTZ27_29280 [Streptomyces griseocarneus]